MTKIFIWNCLENLTSSWHHEGAAVVVANTVEEAMELIRVESPEVNFFSTDVKDEKTGKWKQVDPFLVNPDFIYSIEDLKPVAHIFPDSGCC